MNCVGPQSGKADLWIKIWEELDDLCSEEILIDFDHDKEHRTEEDRQHMSLCEKFITEGNEKADEMEDLWRRPRARTIQQQREEVYAALQYAASFHRLVKE